MNEGRSKRGTFMIADLLCGLSPSEEKLPLRPEVTSSDSATGCDVIVDDVRDYSTRSPATVTSRDETQNMGQPTSAPLYESVVPTERVAVFSATETFSSKRPSIVKPLSFGSSQHRVLFSSNCFRAPAGVLPGSADQRQDSASALDAACQSLQRVDNRCVTPFHWHAVIQQAVRTAELSRRQELAYRQSSPSARQMATQSVFPVFRSASGTGISPEALVAPNPLTHLNQLAYREVSHAGDYLGRIKCRRNRTVFTDHHLANLERSFERQKYLSSKERTVLAAELGLSQIQVKTWYQNRRMKWKKQVLQDGGREPPTRPKGRPRKHENDD